MVESGAHPPGAGSAPEQPQDGTPQDCVRRLSRGSPLDALETRMLLEHVLARPRAWLLAHDTDPLPDHAVQAFHLLVQRRQAGEPMAYILGRREFMQWDFEVDAQVLIPRPDTELLVETAQAWLAGRAQARVLDMGTGSGAIAVSLALLCPQAEVTASDRSPGALTVARRNGQRLGASVRWLQGDWYAALPETETFDLIVSNPPYIAEGDPHLTQGDLRFEPGEALASGGDGLLDLRRIIDGATARLVPGGALWLEHGWDQAAAVRTLLQEAGLVAVESRRDLAGIERISGGTRTA